MSISYKTYLYNIYYELDINIVNYFSFLFLDF